MFIKHPLIVRGNRRFLHVVSVSPLFHPSFNLLLKAERATGPIFENYLITVDFQDSVSLKGIRSKGKSKGILNESSQKAPGSKSARPEPASGGKVKKAFPESGTLGVDKGDSPVVARKPSPLAARKINPPPDMKAFPKPAPKKETRTNPAPLKSRPSPTSPKGEKASPVVKAMLSPKEVEALEEKLLAIVDDWKDSWEKENLGRHMALFYKEPAGSAVRRNRGFAYWRQHKKKMFARHENVQINIQRPGIVRLNNKVRVEFDQSFESDQMQSSGRKTIEFAPSGSEWKIVREDFKVKNFVDKARGVSSAPKASRLPLAGRAGSAIVVHASTMPDFSSATRLVNELRQMGFDAYSSPLYESQTKNQYSVFVGRFSKMALAQELTRSLKKFGDTRNAVPAKFPYVLQIGEHPKKADAEKQAMELQSMGFPSYLYLARKNKSSGAVTRVFVGTFADRKNAMMLAKELMGRGIISVVKEP